ncbi:hypothetical protein [Micromonospora sp. NPDC049679]|uniref:hypothetical protein n=1 Tax=Micromonospora sp. NPDC049679 TaxID=3155920 RepID=UPI0033E64AE7
MPLAAVLTAPETTGTPAVVRGTAVTATLLQALEDAVVTYELYRLRIAPGTVHASLLVRYPVRGADGTAPRA